ncbi:MAG: hypothetical protein AAGM22_30090, partial [Acidobacteriota bacterium]
QNTLRQLVERASSGEELVITDGRGLAQARLVPVEEPRRRPGGWEGKVRILDSFDDPVLKYDVGVMLA